MTHHYVFTSNGDLQEISGNLDPEKLTAWGDALDATEQALPPIRERLDALNDAMADEDWCPPRVIEGELAHLDSVLSGYHLRKYMKDVLALLDEAEADLATWRALSPAARDERWAEWERAEAERAARRQAEAQLRARSNEFYAAMKLANVSPPRWMDNQIANWSLA